MTLRTWARLNPSILSARKTSSRMFFPISGPTTRSAVGTLTTPQDDEEGRPADEPEHAEELRVAQAGEGRRAPDEVNVVAVVAPEILGDEADDRIIEDVEGEDLAVEFLFLQDDEEDGEIQEIEGGLVKLDRVERRAELDPRELAGVLVVERHRPGGRAFAPVAAAGAEAADPAEAVAHGQGRPDDVRRPPGRDLLAVEIPQGIDRAEEKPSLKDAA